MDSLTMVAASLEEIQTSIYNKALSFREYNITRVDSYDEFKTSR
jgi:prolyl-tRNA synthetase